ncbi:hypothetical protein [Pontixanthobacter aquaemixtae]|uniref:Secreted protein n=1 Tax=Pontixanthobacter aquaemixtae TaxID=1958940 RepID=A0A844ZRE3_9SPHN|nr:hypothetical protein [Pontixanthobacter aquaemixtae]MXO89377.1 hypothetical protein [Pontixanthobacter aquaemixtae]
MIRYAILLIAAPVLAGCGDNSATTAGPADDDRSVSGDVLEGSISDEMLPLDELESSSPPANPGEAEDAAADDSDDSE